MTKNNSTNQLVIIPYNIYITHLPISHNNNSFVTSFLETEELKNNFRSLRRFNAPTVVRKNINLIAIGNIQQ